MNKKVNISIIIAILITLISCSSKRYEPIISKEEFTEISDFLIDKKGLEGCPIITKFSRWNSCNNR